MHRIGNRTTEIVRTAIDPDRPIVALVASVAIAGGTLQLDWLGLAPDVLTLRVAACSAE